MMFILMLSRRVYEAAENFRAAVLYKPFGYELGGKILGIIGLVVAAFLLAACGKGSVELAPASTLSEEARRASPEVQETYRFAFANQELLQQIPCYCGCGGVGHTSNYACYVENMEPDGSVKFDYHAFN